MPKYAFSGMCAPSAGCSCPGHHLGFSLGVYPVNDAGKKCGRAVCRVVGRMSSPQEAYDTAQAVADWLGTLDGVPAGLLKKIPAGAPRSKWTR